RARASRDRRRSDPACARRLREHGVDRARKAPPFALLGPEGGASLAGQPVDAAPAARIARPTAGEETAALEPVQRRIDRSLGKRKSAAAPSPQLLDDRVAVNRPARHHREQQRVEMTLKRLCLHLPRDARHRNTRLSRAKIPPLSHYVNMLT